MKVVVPLALLWLSLISIHVSSAGQTCSAYKCLLAGSTCDPHNVEYAVCPTGYYCNGKCEPLVRVGGACTALECVPNAWCNTTKGMCVEIEYMQEGQPCFANEFCVGDLQCVNSVCKRLPRLGEDCSANSLCTGSSACNAATKKCTSFFSTPLGGSCTDTRECVAGSFCSVTGVCTVGFQSSFKACNYTSQCNPNEVCQCPSPQITSQALNCTAPPVYSKDQASVITEYFNCIEKHNCFFWDTTCKQCKKPFCNYFNKYESKAYPVPTKLQTCLGNPDIVEMCAGEGESSQIGLGGVVLIVVGVVVVVTIIIAGAIGAGYLLRNRKHSRPSSKGYSRLIIQDE